MAEVISPELQSHANTLICAYMHRHACAYTGTWAHAHRCMHMHSHATSHAQAHMPDSDTGTHARYRHPTINMEILYTIENVENNQTKLFLM